MRFDWQYLVTWGNNAPTVIRIRFKYFYILIGVWKCDITFFSKIIESHPFQTINKRTHKNTKTTWQIILCSSRTPKHTKKPIDFREYGGVLSPSRISKASSLSAQRCLFFLSVFQVKFAEISCVLFSHYWCGLMVCRKIWHWGCLLLSCCEKLELDRPAGKQHSM